jgi:hypothetical protein
VSVTQIAKAVLQLERELRPIAFMRDWFGEEGEMHAMHDGAGQAPRDGPSSGTSSRAVSRTASAADLRTTVSQGMAQAVDAQGSVSYDPYDIRFERRVTGGWEVNRRHHAAQISGVNRLPYFLVKKVRFFLRKTF